MSEVYIYVSDRPIAGLSSKGQSHSGQQKQSGAVDKPFLSKYIVTRVAESSIHSAENMISNYIQSIGYEKGNYVEMQKEQFAQKIAVRVCNTAVTAGVALATGHPAAAAITLLVNSMNAFTTIYYDNKESEMENRKSNYEASEMSQRAGFSSSKSGSRGTEE